MKRIFAMILSVCLLLSVLSGCGQEETEKTNLVIYTSESQDLVTDMLEDFVSQNPDITYTLFRSGTGKVTAKVDTEREAGSVDADVLWIADLGYLSRLDEEGMIHHYTSPRMTELPAAFNYNDGMAAEVRQIFNIIAYNTTACETAPKDWNNLADPALKGKIAMANPSYSGGALTTVLTHVSHPNIGWDLYEKLIQNDLKLEESNGNLQTKVSSGEYAAVSMVDFMARNAKKEGAPVETVWPESGAVIVPTPIAILEKEDPAVTNAAERLIDYLLSEDAQKLFSEQGYIPVDAAVASPEGAPQAGEIKTCPLDLDFFVSESSAVRDRFESMLGW